MKKCNKFWFPKHNWTKWEDIESGKLLVGEKQPVGRYIYQQKECQDCGKKELREIRT